MKSEICRCALLLASLQTATPITLPPPWRWSNPAPHGANVVDQASVGALTVQVGERGQVFLSDDWGTWTPRDSGTSLAFRGVTFLGGRIVITGEGGSVMVADNPWDFYGQLLGTSDWLESVAASKDRVVAVGDNAAIYVSTNGLSWQRASAPFTNWLRSVAFGTNFFVAVGERGAIATSQNGMNWQARASGTTTNLNRVAWLGDHYLAIGDGGRAFASGTATTWSPVSLGTTNALLGAGGTEQSHAAAGVSEVRLSEQGGAWASQFSASLSSPAPVWTYYSALWQSGYYLLAGQTGMLVEGVRTNLAEPPRWSPLARSVRTWLWQVARAPNHYVAVGDYGTILTSPNGIDWDLELVPDAATNSILLGTGGSSNLWLAVGSQGTILWGTNVFFWHPISPRPTANDLQGVCFDGERFVVTGGNGTILTSLNGRDWIRRTTPSSGFIMSVTACPAGLVAVGEDGVILVSGDGGTNWTAQVSGTTNWLSQVRWLNDRLIAVGENGTILVSTNAQSWTPRLSGTTRWLNAAEFIEDTWFVVGNQGTVLGSPDTTNWANFGTSTRKSLYGAVIHNGQMIAVGTEGVVLRSQLASDPTPIQFASFARTPGYNAFLFTGGVDQIFRLQSSVDLVNWSTGARLEFLDGTGTLLYVEEATGDAQSYYRAWRERGTSAYRFRKHLTPDPTAAIIGV